MPVERCGSSSFAEVQDEAERETTHLAALQAREDFLSMASHELKTPMTHLVLLAQGLLRGESSPPVDADIRRKLESLQLQIMRLAEITDDLFGCSKGPPNAEAHTL